MSNSSLVNYTKLSPHIRSRGGNRTTKISPHHMAGNLTVEACGNVFQGSRVASAHYGIGTDGRVGNYADEIHRTITSSSVPNDNVAVTIEVANDGGESTNWHVSDKALAKLIDLCVDICQRNDIPELIYTGDSRGNLTHHNMFAATTCPGPYLQSKMPYIADEVNKRLGIISLPDKNGCPYGTSVALVKNGSVGTHVKRCQWYLTQLGYSVGAIDGECGSKTVAGIINFQRAKGLVADGICGVQTWTAMESALDNTREDEDMTDEKFAELMNKYRDSLRDNDSGTWSEEARRWAIDTELFVGSGATASGDPNYMWEDLLTREQAATLMYRLARLLGKA